MSDEFKQSAADCSHENQYHDVDIGEPGLMYENWHCQDCGAAVTKVYEPQRQIIDPRWR